MKNYCRAGYACRRNYIKGDKKMKCPYCGSERIETGIAWGKTAESGYIGLKSRVGVFGNVSQVYSDLCLDCGTIVRSYIKESTDQKWVKSAGPFGSK